MSSSVNYNDYPAAPAPPGEQHNFVNPETQVVEVMVGIGVVLGVAATTMLIRLFSRLALRQAWAWEDLAVFLGFVAIAAHDAVTFTITGSGSGKFIGTHIWNIKVGDLTKESGARSTVAVSMYGVAAMCVKLALFSLYLRIFRPNRLTRILIFLGIGICVVFYIIYLIVTLAACVPDSQGPCLPRAMHTALALGIFGFISDTYLLIIPIQMVWRLHLPMKKKMAVSVVFMTGILAISCSLCALVFRARRLTAFDVPWISATTFILNNAEVCAGIVCVNVPLLPALFGQNIKKPNWLRSLDNIKFLSSFRSRRTDDSSNTMVKSDPGILLQEQVSIHHGSDASLDAEFREGIETPTGAHFKDKSVFYHYDIRGGSHV